MAFRENSYVESKIEDRFWSFFLNKCVFKEIWKRNQLFVNRVHEDVIK